MLLNCHVDVSIHHFIQARQHQRPPNNLHSNNTSTYTIQGAPRIFISALDVQIVQGWADKLDYLNSIEN